MKAKKYSIPFFYLIAVFLLAIIFLASAVSDFRQGKWETGTFAGLLGLAVGIWFLFMIQTVTIDSDGISYKGVLKPVELRWNEVTNLVPKIGDSFVLRNSDGTRSIYVSSLLSNFADLVSRVRQKCLNLDERELRSFHSPAWILLMGFLLGIAMTWSGISAVLKPFASEKLDAILLFLGPLTFLRTLQLPLEVSFSSDELNVRSLLGERTYKKTEFSLVKLTSFGRHLGTAMFVYLHFSDKRNPLLFFALQEGALAFLKTAEEWLKKKQ